jgi:hypothetical protein
MLRPAADATITETQRALEQAAELAGSGTADWDAAATDLTGRIVSAIGHLDRARDAAIAEMAALDVQLWLHWAALDPTRAYPAAMPAQSPMAPYPMVMMPGYGMPPSPPVQQPAAAPSVSTAWQRLVGATPPSPAETPAAAASVASPAPPTEATPQPEAAARAEPPEVEAPAEPADLSKPPTEPELDQPQPLDQTADLIGEQTNLVVYGFESFSTVSWFLRAVQGIDEVRGVRVRRFHRGTLHVMIEHEGVGSLDDKLGRIGSAEYSLNLLNAGTGRVEAQLVAVEEAPEDQAADGVA